MSAPADRLNRAAVQAQWCPFGRSPRTRDYCALQYGHTASPSFEHIEEYPRMSRPVVYVGQPRQCRGRSFAVTAMGWSFGCVSVMVYSAAQMKEAVFELGRATIDDIEEAGLQLLGDRAAAAAADDAIVEFANPG